MDSLRRSRPEHRGPAWPVEARATLWLAIIARIPTGCLGLLLILRGRELDYSFAVSAGMSATFVAASALGALVVGRLIDRQSQFRVLLPCAALSWAALVGLVLLPSELVVGVFALALVAGLTQPPVTACIRATWTRTLPAPVLHRVLAADASVQELTFAAGPMIFVTASVHSSTTVGILLAATTISLSTVIYAVRPLARQRTVLPGEAGASPGALRNRSLRRLVTVGFVMGVAIGMMELGIIAFADDFGSSAWIGVLYGVWGLGNLVGGRVLARRPSAEGDLVAALSRSILVFAGVTAAVALAQGTWTLGVLLFVAGVPAASIFAFYYGTVGAVSSSGSMTEAFTWGTTGTITGLATGTILGGFVTGSQPTWVLMVLGASVLVLSALLARTVTVAVREA